MNKFFVSLGFLFICFIAFNQELTIEKIWKKYEFYAKSVEGFKSMKDGENYTRPTKDRSIKKYSIANATDQGTTLVDGKDLLFNGKEVVYDDYEFNADESKILFLTETVPVYRRSFKAVYFLYDIASIYIFATINDTCTKWWDINKNTGLFNSDYSSFYYIIN